MSIDIIRQLFNIENKSKSYNRINSERMKFTPGRLNNSFKLTEKNDMMVQTIESINEENESKNEKTLKSLHVFDILKSYLCNSNKDKLISLCHDIITKDMSVEIIKERFYNLLRIYDSILEIEKYEPRFKKIRSIITDI